MEKEQEREMRKLLNVLRRMARTARMSQWTGVKEQADTYSLDQYNRIAARLEAIDPASSKGLFGALPPDATWSTLSNACRDLAAYYEDDNAASSQAGWSGIWTDARSGIWIDKSAFRHGMPPEVNELGHFIREKIAEWHERKGGKAE